MLSLRGWQIMYVCTCRNQIMYVCTCRNQIMYVCTCRNQIMYVCTCRKKRELLTCEKNNLCVQER